MYPLEPYPIHDPTLLCSTSAPGIHQPCSSISFRRKNIESVRGRTQKCVSKTSARRSPASGLIAATRRQQNLPGRQIIRDRHLLPDPRLKFFRRRALLRHQQSLWRQTCRKSLALNVVFHPILPIRFGQPGRRGVEPAKVPRSFVLWTIATKANA